MLKTLSLSEAHARWTAIQLEAGPNLHVRFFYMRLRDRLWGEVAFGRST